MYISRGNFSKVFDDIKRTSMSHSTCKLIIFVACLNVDALCASKILTNVLRKEIIQYQLIPIVGYSDLKTHYDRLDGDITNIVLLGCGAMVDLESFFDIDPNDFVDKDNQNLDGTFTSSRSIYVIDGHKPWNLDNIFGSHIIKCLDDGYIDRELDREKEAYATLIKLQEDEEEEDSDDGEFDSEESENENDVVNGLEEDEDEELTSSQEKKRKAIQETKQRKRQMKEQERLVEQYYATGMTITVSVSLQVYTMLSEIGETNTDNLWFTIIGTISLDNLYPDVYRMSFEALKAEVTRLSPTDLGLSKNADSSQLSVDTDYYLFLLRHWTLYDSFFYSNYVNAKLSIWSEEGRKRLHKMFARMGISLQDSKQNWLYMDTNIKKNLNVTFNKVLGFFGLDDLIREGFVRTYGFRGTLSASECVESISALLEHNKASTTNTDDEETDINELISLKEKAWIENFWSSWDALDNIDKINKGLEYAKEFQKAVFNTGMAVLEKRLLKTLKIYHLVVLRDGPDYEMFRNPLILIRLGNWILESCAESNKTLLPLVLAALDESTDTFLVVGLAPRYPRGRKNLEDIDQNTTLLNTFSVAFQQVAGTTGAKVRIDSFESSIIEIRKEDFQPFLEKLALSGLV
ncbi:DNA replication initiation factor CDC45 [Cyberlindnera jadinii NRRL Y-1542]|uniref:CDC45-like protein n=1 Tax=Cyberlindnera jadinii (strain ATCC 18201 / CBS 1600 / BCRC 20928 / JCM 3617 / NBRC 0987 / NRRL Y-1542) TaxID=983966 RepID=A0A1E4S0M9_CYBJN|nr:CDC45-like protein [Cyberlindnera jadinii NRRL Y-1542]ODV73031.1 CDC45-like protein [Cyberlindnera jadinii NRRL Y-1542]